MKQLPLEARLDTVKNETEEKGKRRLTIGIAALLSTAPGAYTTIDTATTFFEDYGSYPTDAIIIGGGTSLLMAAMALYFIPKGIYTLYKARRMETTLAQANRPFCGMGFGDERYREDYHE